MYEKIKKLISIRRIAMAGLALVVIRELIFCILDMMIHTLFVAAALFFLYVLFMDLYKSGSTEEYKYASWVSFGATILIMVTSIFYSYGWFQSYEVVQGSIGYVSVMIFENDLFCISNGREDEVFLTRDNDIYIAKMRKGEDALVRHFEEQIGKEVVYEKNEYGSYEFYVVGEEKDVHASGSLERKYGYEIWEIVAYHDLFKHKNILGGVYNSVNDFNWDMFDEFSEDYYKKEKLK